MRVDVRNIQLRIIDKLYFIVLTFIINKIIFFSVESDEEKESVEDSEDSDDDKKDENKKNDESDDEKDIRSAKTEIDEGIVEYNEIEEG